MSGRKTQWTTQVIYKLLILSILTIFLAVPILSHKRTTMFFSKAHIPPLLISTALAFKDPGLPFPNPTISYWQIPPHPNISTHQSSSLPSQVDVLVIGSGITGTSIAHHLLTNGSSTSPLRIAMVDARAACSGATGRNGGHIRPSAWEAYASLKEVVGRDEAEKITRLNVMHVQALIDAAGQLGEAGREASEARRMDSIDGYFDAAKWDVAVKQLEELKNEVPDLGAEFEALSGEEARRISMLQETVGIITGSPKVAGAIWPYRFVTRTLEALLEKYPSFSLDTMTPVSQVSLFNSSSTYPYTVITSRGNISTRHVIYATNGWTPHFVPALSQKMFSRRLHMSAQLGGASLPQAGKWPSYTNTSSLSSGRAFSLPRKALDYIVQQPRNGELMFGGGRLYMSNPELEETMDDSLPPDHGIASYLNGALPNYFGYENWGAERQDFPVSNNTAIYPGRTKRVWTGIEAWSRDDRPFVGILSGNITGRHVSASSKAAEWVSAVYTGEGMCFGWLSGQALAAMLLSKEKNGSPQAPDWFPRSMMVTEERLNSNGTHAKRAISMRNYR